MRLALMMGLSVGLLMTAAAAASAATAPDLCEVLTPCAPEDIVDLCQLVEGCALPDPCDLLVCHQG